MKFFQKIMIVIDKYYLKREQAVLIPNSQLQMLKICYHQYEGRVEREIDGVKIAPGDMVGELHIVNSKILEIASEKSKRPIEWRLIELFRREIVALSEACVSGEIPIEVKGFFGISVLSTGIARLGFTIIPLSGAKAFMIGFWETLLRRIYYSFKRHRSNLPWVMPVSEVWLTRAGLEMMAKSKAE